MTIALEIKSKDTDESRAIGVRRWTVDGRMLPLEVVRAGEAKTVNVWKGANIFLEEIDAAHADLYLSGSANMEAVIKQAKETVTPIIKREAANERRGSKTEPRF